MGALFILVKHAKCLLAFIIERTTTVPFLVCFIIYKANNSNLEINIFIILAVIVIDTNLWLAFEVIKQYLINYCNKYIYWFIPELEAMYKYRDSQYYTAPKPPSPRTPGAFRPSPSPPKRPMTTTSSQSRGAKQSGSSLQVRAKSAPIYDFKPVPRLQIPTPHQCWAMATEETNYTIPSPQPVASPVPYTWPSPQPATPASSFKSDKLSKYDYRSERIKSAVIRRDRPAAPKRPVKSAGPSRETTHRSGSPTKVLRPKTPSPIELEEMAPEDEVPTEELYDENLKKFGWRMEVHGDPYNLK